MRIIYIFISLLSIILLSGCGAAQSVAEGSSSVAKALFVWDVKTLHLDFTARAELNTDDDGRSSPVVIRIYQLLDSQAFTSASYPELVNQDSQVLAKSLITTKEIVLRPDTSISVDTPFDSDAKFVGIIALYRDPDLQNDSWRIVIRRWDLNINSARKITVNPNTLELIKD